LTQIKTIMSFRSLLESFLTTLFPDRCGGCARLGDLLCQRCRAALVPYPHQPDRLPASLDDVRVAFVFASPLREVVHQFKYRRVRHLAQPLGRLMAEHLIVRPLAVDAVLPVPLHHERLAERGFNQAEALAREVARALGLPLLAHGLERARATQQQAHLDARQRADNVRGAFRWRGTLPPQRLLIVDDVLTTGATIGACAEALREAGAEAIYGLALARSRPDRA
jgi:ComF family protein